MELWLGKDYLLSMFMVVLFCIYFYSMRVGDIAAVYRQATGLWWEDKMRPVIESVVNLILNIVVVKNFGMVGVLISTIISIVLINIPWASYVLYKYYFKESVISYYKHIIENALVVIFVMIVTYSICIIVPFSGILALISKGIICCIIPNVMFWVIYHKTHKFKAGVNLIRRMLDR